MYGWNGLLAISMERRFIELLDRIGAKCNSKEEFDKLILMYSEPHRFYHNIKHIQKCLTEFDFAKHLMSNPDSVEFAIWYHDIIYNPRAKDNEEKSAQFAYDVCVDSKLSKEFADKVKNLILTTKHNIITKDVDSKFLVDIDLSTFGGSLKEFNQYSDKIRKEYSFSSEEIYRNGRIKVLQMFLDRDRIYLTDFFRNKYEVQARKNITLSLDNLIN